MTDLSVIVPSYRRPADLRRCLEALCGQQLTPAQVVVVVRDVDEATQLVAAAFAGRLPLEIVKVSEPGVVQAMNAGMAVAKGEILALTDDDAAPHADWTERLLTYYEADPRIGGVGGRDWVHTPEGAVIRGQRHLVGRVQWFGRIVGNHHLGAGPAREVDILKGVNLSFRRSAIDGLRFDTRLRGQGAQVHWEICICLAVKNRGWKLIYDPAVAVDHYPAPRADIDQRGAFHPLATENSTFNLIWATELHLRGYSKIMVRIWNAVVGTPDEPALVNFLRSRIKGKSHALERWRSAQKGRRKALLEIKKQKSMLSREIR